MAMADYSLSDLAAVTGDNGGLNGGNGGWFMWIIVLFLLTGWGGRGWGGQANAQPDGAALYPWLNQAQTQWQGVSDIQQALCNGFAGAEASAAARQMADMQQAFGMQTAMMQGFNAQQAQLAQCCCDNRLATANLAATIAQENCADRQAVSDALQAVSAQNSANTQRILDQMCQDKIDAKNEEIANLRQQVAMMNLSASQNLQTAQLLADNAAQTNALEQYLAPTPRPAYMVQNPNCCQPFNCGCGM